MPTTKLTLSADKQIVERAKRIAAARGTSLSAMVNRFLDAISRPAEGSDLGPITRRASGLIKLPTGASLSDLLTAAAIDRIRSTRATNPLIMAGDYPTAAELAFYLSGQPKTYCIGSWVRHA
ncbi:MAG TPA: DUF6364 family protein, partial [Tepidisphaeraceae bacterium]|nr:DUF6364 family protein [Tepidisphaeraceae bacterium]